MPKIEATIEPIGKPASKTDVPGVSKDGRVRRFLKSLGPGLISGAAMTFSGIKPIAALFWTAVINGILSPFFLVLIMQSARSRKVMGDQPIGPLLTALGWTVTAAMFLVLFGLSYLTFAG